MAVLPQDLQQPTGMLVPELFPADTEITLADRLQAYITAGEALANATDASVTAYAYWRAYQAAHLLMLTAPMSASIEGQGSQTYNAEQLRSLATLRDQYQAEYLALLSATPVAPPAATVRMPTMAVPTRIGS